MSVSLMDCTLRDGANVVGKGFSAEITDMVLDGLTACHVPIIEFGNAGGIGAYEVAGFTSAETDWTYLDIAQKYLDRGSQLGMFLNAKRYREKNVALAKESGLSFLRVGADAGDADIAVQAVKDIKKAGLKAFYSAMKAYLLTPNQLAEEGKKLEQAGLDEITIMDSAGTMHPADAGAYVEALKARVKIPVGFHCHSNLGLSAANALAAAEHGADILDCGLLGMARSAGNMPTELAVALMHQQGKALDVDLYKLLEFEDQELIPAMEKEGYHAPLKPKDLILGYSGAHSSFMRTFKAVAQDCGVDLYHLIVETSKVDRKSPSEDLMRQVAAQIKEVK